MQRFAVLALTYGQTDPGSISAFTMCLSIFTGIKILLSSDKVVFLTGFLPSWARPVSRFPVFCKDNLWIGLHMFCTTSKIFQVRFGSFRGRGLVVYSASRPRFDCKWV